MLTVLFLALAAPSAAEPDRDREVVELSGEHGDMQFLVGGRVKVSATVTDDVFAAGRYVSFTRADIRNVIAAGYEVTLDGGVVADMIAAGSTVRVAGRVVDDLVAAGGTVRIAPEGAVESDVRAVGETIEVEGVVGGSLRAAARSIRIEGSVGGKADLSAERIVIGPAARIGGDLIYRSHQPPEIAAGAVIEGDVRHIEMDLPDIERIGLTIFGIGLVIGVAWAVAVLLLVVVIQAAFPSLVGEAAAAARARPWNSLGRGVATLMIALAASGLLFASVLGVPLGAALFFTTALLALVGLTVAAQWAGFAIRRWRRRSDPVSARSRMGWTVLGLVALALVSLIPFLGWIVVGLIVAAGVGAAASRIWQRGQPAYEEAG
ncbi:hypothetical protein CVT23_07330 [Minwuia thermotolerans]|uniref:Polymer-forming cytoskeletal protein n=1 Tax=Minwuia thermotolerans TaxID=2056226 RepID=A0A2M9G3B9_9PROT|nr:hypothetical protein CVT23_07330 [Minwuia thermotolerans]